MAIAMICGCGLTIRARDEHAGKRIKCPQCGQVAVVPAAASPPRPPERQASSIQFEEEIFAAISQAPAPAARPSTPASGSEWGSPQAPAPAAAPSPPAPPKPPGVDPWGYPSGPAPAGPASQHAGGEWRTPYPVLSALVVLLRVLALILFVLCGLALLIIIALASGSTILGFASAWLLLPQTIFLFLCGIALLVASEAIRVGVDAVRVLGEIRDELKLARLSG